ncbi:MAG: metallophosphoesterase family protein [Candidatus Eiseniibacteriota bacterium]
MRVAALFDIHSNLPALDAVLEEIRRAGIDQIVVGGDVLPGPMPRETLGRLLELDRPTHYIHGNGELAILALLAAPNEDAVTYWGTTSGAPMPEQYRPNYRWTAKQIEPDYPPVLARWPKTLRMEIDGLGAVFFCHGTPRSETELFTRLTLDERLEPIFDELDVSVVICGHTHMQFDRQVGRTRVVNAGSIGEPYGEPGAHWLVLGPDVELRRTPYDFERAAERIRATTYPDAEAFARDILHPPSEAEMLEVFTPWELK